VKTKLNCEVSKVEQRETMVSKDSNKDCWEKIAKEERFPNVTKQKELRTQITKKTQIVKKTPEANKKMGKQTKTFLKPDARIPC